MVYCSNVDLLTLEETTLRRLPDNFKLIDGVSVIERANQLAQKKVEIYKRRRQARERLRNSPYSVAEDYYGIYLEQGENKANQWLLGE